jgi:glycosidase
MDFPLQEAIIQSVKEKQNPWDPKWISIYSALANDFLYPHPNDLVIFADNHDMSRVYTQLNEDKLGLKQTLVFLATTRGIPQIYYGTEVLLTNPKSDDHGEIRADMPGGWSTDSSSVFIGKNLRVDQTEMLKFTQSLFQWRKNAPVVHQGKLMHYSPQNGIYIYFRYTDNEKVMVVLNKNKQPLTVSLADYTEMTSGLQTGQPILVEGAEVKPQNIHFTKPGFCIIPLVK